ncbi:MAG: sigma-70 family RNA polymerase sigma factor [Bacteroidota bacterium]|nr:sigma-70 family RNA polymerase sigma factor [Bacteroidota bacterium]
MLSNHSYRNHTDEELIALYKKTEDLDIVGILYDRYTALTFGVCLKYLKDREESRDAVMQIFEKLIISLKTHEINVFKAWLYVTARNHCLMHLRSRKGKNFEELSPFLVETGSNGHHEHGREIEDDLNRLEQCINSLVAEQQQCVRLFYLEQKCYREITQATGYDLKKVKSYIQNGKRNLKICMERNEKS